MNIKSLILALTFLALPTGFVLAQETQNTDKVAAVQVVNAKTPPSKEAKEVGNKICPISGDKIPAPGEKGTMGDDGPVKVEYMGKIYNLCCPMCVKDFKKNPEKYSAVAEKEVSSQK